MRVASSAENFTLRTLYTLCRRCCTRQIAKFTAGMGLLQITLDTKDVFIEATATDLTKAKVTAA